jgi:hypothetical protein
MREWVIRAACLAALATVSAGTQGQDAMQEISRKYVRLVLAMGAHDKDYVDAYYGPAELKEQVEAEKLDLAAIGREAAALVQSLAKVPQGDEELSRLRHRYLERQLSSLGARVRMLKGERLSFDAESKALYDSVAPTYPESHFQAVLDRLERRFPGQGPLVGRYDAWRRAFVIPRDRLDAVFQAAISACRERTVAHVQLPPDERFTVEYVTNKSWSGYNWYQGNYRSLIQVNTDLPIYIDRAVDLACHEGYPGHHVYNALLEKHLVRDRGWVEFSVYALFSPQSLIAEGTANYGIEVAFPGDERVVFERDVLFRLAGLDPSRAATYAKVRALVDRLSYAGNEAARKYLNGQATRTETVGWLQRYAMMPAAAAEQRTRFFDTYRSYVINYNLGKDLVKQYVESRGGSQPEKRWQEFVNLLASPRLPSALRAASK